MYVEQFINIHFEGKIMTDKRLKKLEGLYSPEKAILPTATLRDNGFCNKDIVSLVDEAKLRKVRRGYYGWTPYLGSLNDMEVVASLVPEGVLSLYSAAQYHDLTTVIPPDIDITLPSTMRTPVLPDDLHVKVFKSAMPIYQAGIERVVMDDYTVKVYDRERTVCDFMRMRNKVGKDVALEVLKNYMVGTKRLSRLYEYAALLQIEGVIHPYLEVLV
jgi:hypothetical protein